MAENDEGNWYDGITPESEDNTAIRETLSNFDTSEAYFEHVNGLENADWRDPYAMDADGKVDDKFKATLQRFSTPADAGMAFREAQQTISAGKQHQPLAADANEDDVKAYREANGIPLESKGYMENLPDGLILGDDDKEIFASFADKLHEKNARPEIAHAALERYNGFAEEAQDARGQLDSDQSAEATSELRTAWGGDYRANINMVEAFLETTFGSEAKTQLLDGRFKDGRAFMNDPAIMQGIAEVQRRLDPLTRHDPSITDPLQTVEDEISELEKFQKDHRTEYFADEKKQARLNQLYQMRIDHAERIKKSV